MTIERTDVQVEVKGEQQAVAKTNTVAAAMERLRLKAEQAKAAAADAERMSLRARASNFLSAKNMLGMAKGGFGPNSVARGLGGGAMGALMALRLGPAAAEGASGEAADLADYMRSNPTAKQMVQDAGSALHDTFVKPVQGAIANTAANLRRLFGGVSKERAEAEAAELLSSLDPAKGAAEDAAHKAAMRKLRQQAADLERREQEALEARIQKMNEASEEMLTKGLAGLANETLSVGLHRGTAMRYRAMREEQHHQANKLRKVQGRQKIMMEGEGD